jgi:3-dehydroquinate synthase
MTQIPIQFTEGSNRGYRISLGQGLLADLFNRLNLQDQTVFIVSDHNVYPHFEAALLVAAKAANCTLKTHLIPAGETSKDWQQLYAIQTWLLSQRANRKSSLVALGGGVVGDIAGFAAAIYQRGMRFVQVPTTLLAQVDSSVGGKVAVNHPLGKNMLGAFYQPQAVVIDTDTLASLPDRELSAGLAEVIKYGLIADAPFFAWLEANMPLLLARDTAALCYAIEVSCRAKALIVGEDETEQGIRAILNLGHTFGHAIETGLGYGVWLHGEAVAAGMVAACRVSVARGAISQSVVDRLIALLLQAHLPINMPNTLSSVQYWELMQLDKKSDAGVMTFILLRALGKAEIVKGLSVADVSVAF